MKILVVGPESSGTRMLTALLSKCEGVEAIHSSPAYRKSYNKSKYDYRDYDQAVLIIRNGAWNAESMKERGHFRSDVYGSPRLQILDDLWYVLKDLSWEIPVHVVTYESMVYETEACIKSLCEALDVPPPVDYDEVKNGNEKFWSADGWAGDNRTTAERLQ